MRELKLLLCLSKNDCLGWSAVALTACQLKLGTALRLAVTLQLQYNKTYVIDTSCRLRMFGLLLQVLAPW